MCRRRPCFTAHATPPGQIYRRQNSHPDCRAVLILIDAPHKGDLGLLTLARERAHARWRLEGVG